jgi:hypothetical protein
MKNLVKLTAILILAAGIYGCTQKSTSSFKPGSEPDGYAGIKWETKFSDVKSDLVESRSTVDLSEPTIKIKIIYTRKSDLLKLGAASLEKIEYVFWKGIFAEARIYTTATENFDSLKKYLFEKYGAVEIHQGAYRWDGAISKVLLKYDASDKSTLLTIFSSSIASREVKDLLERDK